MYVEIYSFCVWDLDGMIDTWRLSAENGWKSWTGIVYCRCGTLGPQINLKLPLPAMQQQFPKLKAYSVLCGKRNRGKQCRQ